VINDPMNSEQAGPRRLSLVIPVYNEARHLEQFLKAIDQQVVTLKSDDLETELVFIDDCSTDSSLSILESYTFISRATIIKQPKNQGKGAALRRGIEVASGDIIGIQDADFEYDYTEIPKIITPILSGRADVSYGSRFKAGEQVHRTFHYGVNRFLTMLSNIFSGLYLSDMETCYKFFKADVIKNIILESNRFGFEPEITAKIARLKVRVVELPISYFPRNYMEGKKITWRDGVSALGQILYYNLVVPKEKMFKEGLPERYKVAGLHLL
jgi:glycosyltransferase involved in cell wall biosynthesis